MHIPVYGIWWIQPNKEMIIKFVIWNTAASSSADRSCGVYSMLKRYVKSGLKGFSLCDMIYLAV